MVIVPLWMRRLSQAVKHVINNQKQTPDGKDGRFLMILEIYRDLLMNHPLIPWFQLTEVTRMKVTEICQISFHGRTNMRFQINQCKIKICCILTPFI